jgi:hypothetical protein
MNSLSASSTHTHKLLWFIYQTLQQWKMSSAGLATSDWTLTACVKSQRQEMNHINIAMPNIRMNHKNLIQVIMVDCVECIKQASIYLVFVSFMSHVMTANAIAT